MPRTLNDIQNEEGRTALEVMSIQTIKETSPIWKFLNIEDRPTGVSLIDQNVTLPDTNLRNLNTNYSDSAPAIVEQVTIGLQPLGGKHTIDKKNMAFTAARTGKNYALDQVQKYSRSAGLNAKAHILFNTGWGLDKWADIYADRGYETKLAAGTSAESIFSIDLSQLIDVMEAAVNYGNGVEGLIILTDRDILNALRSRLLTEANVSELARMFDPRTETDSNGNVIRNWALWNGVPMLDMGYASNRQRIIRPVYGPAQNETKIFFLNTGDTQSAFLQDRAPEIEMVALNGVLKEVSVDWAIGMEVKDPDAIRVLTGLTLEQTP